MEMHDLTTKMMAKIPKIARNCESWVSCNVGSLPSAFDSTVSIVVTPTAVGTITNSMNVSANESDLPLANKLRHANHHG